MRWLRAALQRAGAALFPWPGRTERAAAIRAARAEKEHSREAAAKAAVLDGQIKRMVQENHFAQSITDQIIASHRGKQP